MATLALNAAVWLRRGLLIASAPGYRRLASHIEAEISLITLADLPDPPLTPPFCWRTACATVFHLGWRSVLRETLNKLVFS